MSDATPSYETLTRILQVLADPKVSKLVVMHHNADPDAVGSALALKFAFPNLQVAAPLGVSRTGKRLLAALGEDALTRPRYEVFEHIIVVDTSSRVQLGPESDRIKEPIIIDHHPYHDTWEDALARYIDPNKAACAELVYEIIVAAAEDDLTSVRLSGAGGDPEVLEKVGLALMTGIWTDTAGFRYATPRTLQVAADLLSQTGTSMADVLEVLEEEAEKGDGRHEAHLKAAARLATHRVGPLLVATSHVSSYEASAARALTLVGADVAFCVAEKNGEIRASARARRDALRRTNIHLGHLMNRAGKRLGFMGGGHAGAAGMNRDPKAVPLDPDQAPPDKDAVLRVLLDELDAELKHPSGANAT